MVNLDELTGKDLQNIGEMVLAELNINLFNAEPTIHKAYQVYVELVHAGYKEKNKQLACEKIKKFFTIRTVRNQRKEFQLFFGIPFSDEMRPFLALSLRNSEIDYETVKKIAYKTNKILSVLNLQEYKLDEYVLTKAVTELYKPKYHENEWRITIPALSNKIKKVLLAQGDGGRTDALEEIFYLMDPNPKKKKRVGAKLIEGGVVDQRKIEDGSDKDKAFKKHELRGPGPGSEFEETLLTRDTPIRESEISFVKDILGLINSDEIPESLGTLYLSDIRHPLVRNFLNSVNGYNLLIKDRERNLKEILPELKRVVRGIRDFGREILKGQEEVIGSRIEELNYEIKKAG